MGRNLYLYISLLAAPAVLSIATLSALFLFLFPNNAAAIDKYYYISIFTIPPPLESTINTTPDETITIQKYELLLNTDNPNGVKVLVSSKDNKTTPTYVTGSGPATGSGSTGTSTIAESTGTISAPTKLSPNSFGFALDENSSTIAANFDTSTSYESTDNTDKLNAKFSKLTPNTTPTEIYNKSGAHNDIVIPVYYGTNTNSLMREGKYEMEVLYTIVSNTLTTDIPEDNNDTIEINPKPLLVRENQTFYKDNTITIKTNIKANQSIIPTDISVKINNKPCTNIIISQNFDDNTSNPDNTLELTCKAPQNPATQAGSKYDLNFTINKYNINITKKNAINYVIPTPMQTFQYSQCTSMNEHEEKFMIDTRDNELYTMAKLKDGKCWMTQNLRYQLSTTKALTPQDSDVQQNWTPNRSTELTLSGRWDQDSEGLKTVRSYYNSTKPEYGTYYTYTAATAGTTANMNNKGDEATGSICPKGWRLPKTGTVSDSPNNDFYNLSKEYKGSAEWDHNTGWGYWSNWGHQMLSGEPKYVLSDGRSSSSADMDDIGTYGFWWSSTVESNKYAYEMLIRDIVVNPRLGGNRNNGLSVRCLAREPQTIGSIEYMQDMTPEHCTDSTEHQTATLKDKRDNNTYTIAKLKDGKCWMTQNLRYQLSTTTPLKPQDSDVQQNWTPNRSTEFTLTDRWDQDPEEHKTVRSYYDSTKPEYGTYYTHTAATAGTATSIDTNNVDAPNSICPKGWRLPKARDEHDSPNNEFYNLSKEYKGSAIWTGGWYWSGSHQMISGEPKYVLSGCRSDYSARLDDTGSGGSYWSSTVDGGYFAYYMIVKSSYVNPRLNHTRYRGFSVRCVAR